MSGKGRKVKPDIPLYINIGVTSLEWMQKELGYTHEQFLEYMNSNNISLFGSGNFLI